MMSSEGFKCKLENGSEMEYISASESKIGIPIIRLDTTDGLRYESPAYYPVKNHKLKMLDTRVITDEEKERVFKLKADCMGE